MRLGRWTLLGATLALCISATANAMERVGEDIEQLVETGHPYHGPADSDEPLLVRSDTFRHAGAVYIAVHFARFELADGDYVIVRSPDGAQTWRYEDLGRAGLGLSAEGFWATHIKGDSAIVELYSRHEIGKYGFKVDHYARGFRPEEMGYDSSTAPDDFEAICGADDAEWAKCYETSEPEIYDKSRAVARLLINGSSLCTGWLVGCEGHLMTNQHCIGSAGSAANTDYEFMGEGATCNTNCFGGLACPGVIEATGATFIQSNGSLDYTLVKLPTNVSTTYGFMTLREEGPTLEERIYIPQHAAGWGKRIAVFSDNGTDASGFCEVFSLNRPPCTGGPGDIGYYCDTQGGSSGSPVLGYADHKVVSLHHCANCPNRGLNISDVINNLGTNLPACAVAQTMGEISLNESQYACDAVLTIAVRDDSIAGQGSETVDVWSGTESTPEVVVLVEDGPSSGNFVGTLPLTEGTAAEGNGILSVSDSDTISALYIDADDGTGGADIPRQADASTDCLAPQISSVSVANVTTSTARIGWQTDEAATSRVNYGTSPPGSQSIIETDYVTSHSIDLAGLQECTEHYFFVASVDGVGNSTIDDNGGLSYTFETACVSPPAISSLTAERTLDDGSKIRVTWDNSCVQRRSKILYGPLDQVSTYGISGAVCNIQPFANPKNWIGVPDGDLWFIMVTEDGVQTESSWGESSSGERNGLTASGQCSSGAIKDLSAQCP